jgi:ribosomal protein L7/L12
LTNKIYSIDGTKHTPLEFAYQNQWIKKNWKETHLLTTILISEDEQDSGKDEEEVVKEIWEIELTSVDPSQKIKIIKVLREMFNLGLKEAKEIADKTPSLIKRERKEDAEKIKEQL